LGEYYEGGWWSWQAVRAGGRLVAHYWWPGASGLTEFAHPNALGSSGMVTDASGAVQMDEIRYPWGPEWNHTGSRYDEHFAGMQWHDYSSGLDPTPFRQYSGLYGRWMSPDPAGLAAVDLTNPQSFNAYAYVMNNPMTFTDPLGKDYCLISSATTDDNGNVAYSDSDCMSDEEYASALGADDGSIDPSQYSYIDTTSSVGLSADISALGDIQVDITGPTTANISSPYSLSDTVSRIEKAVGLAPSNIDNNLTRAGLDTQHGKDAFHLRDFDTTCTLHVTLNLGPGGQSLTTGNGHLDSLNPSALLIVPGVPQEATQGGMGLAHLALDYFHLYPGAAACQ
jgi:RHS repeat-associated protein